MKKQNKQLSAYTIHPRWLHYLDQIAKADQRSKSNMLEVLIEQECNRRREAGFVFEPYPGDQPVIGRGADETLKQQFDAFTKGGRP